MNADSVLPPALFRREYGKIVSAMVGRYGAHRLSDIEDCVQFAMTQALSHWRKDKIPPNPGAWLATVAKRKLIDGLRRNAALPHDSPELLELQDEDHCPQVRLSSECQHDLLSMLYLCCDPELAPQSQMVLALKILCGFSTREISLRLFISTSATQKRLSRGRAVLATRWKDCPSSKDGTSWEYLAPELRAQRHEAVCRVVYLLFNEGYSSIRQEAPIRKELCIEAIYLGRALLARTGPNRARACALLALMLFHFARFEGRRNAQGEVVLLEHQDRKLWDASQIQEAKLLFFEAAECDEFSRYQAEAAIAMLHCSAPSYEQTNWQEIADLYEILGQMIPSPIYQLNRAIALAQIQGPKAGLDLLDGTRASWLDEYYLWDAALGELHRLAKQFQRAQACFERALRTAPPGWDRELILARQKACRDRT